MEDALAELGFTVRRGTVMSHMLNGRNCIAIAFDHEPSMKYWQRLLKNAGTVFVFENAWVVLSLVPRGRTAPFEARIQAESATERLLGFKGTFVSTGFSLSGLKHVETEGVDYMPDAVFERISAKKV